MNTTFDPYARNVARETLHGHLGPYARNRVREILHGHLGLLYSIEPDEEWMPCGEVVATRRDGDGLLVGVRWGDDPEERLYRLTIAAAEGESL